MNNITLSDATDLIAAIGHHTTVLVQGEMGIGKSSILKALAARFPDHHPAYFDLTTKDVGDFMIPAVHDGVAEFLPNAEFGLHTGKPILLMLDELGKAPKAVMNACLRVMLERSISTTKLPEGSIVFATTNLAIEGVGDSILPHARNRIVVVEVDKPNADGWLPWAMRNGIEPVVMAFVTEFPQVFHSFREYEKPEGNHYINDPRTQRAAFVTHRSMAAASRIVTASREHKLPESVLYHALCGTIGAPAAADFMSVLRLDNDIAPWQDIIDSPTTARIPQNGAAAAMVVYRAIARVDDKSFAPWVKYLNRMSREAQALFARQVMSDSSGKRLLAAKTKPFVDLCRDIGYLFVE